MRIVTYNVRSGLGMDGRRSVARIADVLRELRPEVVCLQETDKCLPRSYFCDQSKRLGKLLGMRAFFCPTMRVGLGEYGIALLTPLPILSSESWYVPNERERRRIELRLERRALQRVVVQTPSGPVAVHNTHWSLNADDRLEAAERAAEIVTGCGAPAVLCGDLNAGPESAEVRLLLERSGLADRGADPAYPSDGPAHRIDYVLLSVGLLAKEVRVVETQASDHRPIVAEVTLRA